MKLAISFVSLLGLFFAGCQVNPVTGENEFNLFSVEQQEEMGAEYSKEVEKELGKSVSDQQLQNYVNSVGQKIVRVCHTPDEGFIYKAIDHNSVNAFALPGGYIYITTGMLEQLNSEAQLAAILAHETAHVTARHSAVGMSRGVLINIGLNVISSASTNVGRVADIVTQLEGMSYSRAHERQADMIGLDYLVGAGYSPNGMIETMEILQKQNDVMTIEFFSTHPSPANRIEYIREDIYNKNYTVYTKTGRTGEADYQNSVSTRLKMLEQSKSQQKAQGSQ